MANGIDIGTLLYYAVYVLLAVVCLVVVARAVWVPMDLHRAPCCGGCGHAVGDILQGRCPECGGMYAKVGISTPSMAVRLRGSLALAILAWTTLMTVAGAYVHGFLQQRAWAAYQTAAVFGGPAIGGKQRESYSTDLSPWHFGFDSVGTPADRDALDFRISLAQDITTDDGKVDSGTLTLGLRKNGTANVFTLTLDAADGSFKVEGSDGKELEKGGAVDEDVIERWFKAAGIKTDAPGLKRSMSDALKITQYAVNDPAAIDSMSRSLSGGDFGALQSQGGSSSSGPIGQVVSGMALAGPSTSGLAIAGAILGVIYIAGCIAITWQHRRLVLP